MAARIVPYDDDVTYDQYLAAVRNLPTDATLDADVIYLSHLTRELGRHLSDTHISQNGLNYSSQKCDILVRLIDADNDRIITDSLDYKKFPLHIELFHPQTKQLIRILPSPTREAVVFYTLYEMAGPANNRLVSPANICYEGVCSTEQLFGGIIIAVFYHFLNKEYGKNAMDYSSYLNFH